MVLVAASNENGAPVRGPITFRGRGLALVCDRGLELRICPQCSQQLPGGTPRATCCWCGYEPSLQDAEPAGYE